MITKEEVLHIAKLARLELTEQEVEKMQKDLSSILDYFDILKKVPKAKAGKVKTVGNNVLRQDEVLEKPANLAGDIVRLAPDQKDGYVKVKQIL